MHISWVKNERARNELVQLQPPSPPFATLAILRNPPAGIEWHAMGYNLKFT